MIFGTNGKKISFEELNKTDKEEFILTASDILMAPDSQIKEIFKEFIDQDPRFKKILKSLLSRKADFLQAFTPEVRNKIEKELNSRKEKEAIYARDHWNAPEEKGEGKKS